MTNRLSPFSNFDLMARTFIERNGVLGCGALALLQVAGISLLVISLGRHALNPILGTVLGISMLVAADIAVVRYLGSFSRFVRSMGLITIVTLPPLLCYTHLEHLHRRHVSTYFSFSGLMPWSDAGGYYLGALSLIETGSVNEFSVRRPMGPGMLAVALSVVKGNLNAVLWIQSMIVALAMAGAALAVGRRFGAAAATLLSIGNFAYIENYLQTTMTEPAGFVFGLLSFCFLWRFFFRRNVGDLYCGLALLVVSQNVRPGVLLVVPAIVLWSGLRQRPARRFAVTTPAVATGIAALAAVLCLGLNNAVSPPNSTGNGNFAYTLYGMSLGENSWARAYGDHPEFNDTAVPESEKVRSCYRYAFANIGADPRPLIMVIGKRLLGVIVRPGYFYDPWREILGHRIPNVLVLAMLIFLIVSGRKSFGAMGFSLSVWLGTICTAPLLFDAGLRSYSGTIAFANVLPALAMGICCSMVAGLNKEAVAESPPQSRFLFTSWLSAAAMVAAALLGPLVIKARAPRRSFLAQQEEARLAGLPPMVFRASAGTFVHTVRDGGPVRYPDIAYSSFVANIPDTSFSGVKAGDYMGPVFNCLGGKESVYLVLEGNPADYAGKYVAVSARRISATAVGTIYSGKISGRVQ